MPRQGEDSNFKFKLPELTDTNFDQWERQLKNALYAMGWIAFYEASEAKDKDSKWDGASDAQRRTAWGTITQSLTNNPN